MIYYNRDLQTIIDTATGHFIDTYASPKGDCTMIIWNEGKTNADDDMQRVLTVIQEKDVETQLDNIYNALTSGKTKGLILDFSEEAVEVLDNNMEEQVDVSTKKVNKKKFS